jgi:hypothetical protein
MVQVTLQLVPNRRIIVDIEGSTTVSAQGDVAQSLRITQLLSLYMLEVADEAAAEWLFLHPQVETILGSVQDSFGPAVSNGVKVIHKGAALPLDRPDAKVQLRDGGASR